MDASEKWLIGNESGGGGKGGDGNRCREVISNEQKDANSAY